MNEQAKDKSILDSTAAVADILATDWASVGGNRQKRSHKDAAAVLDGTAAVGDVLSADGAGIRSHAVLDCAAAIADILAANGTGVGSDHSEEGRDEVAAVLHCTAAVADVLAADWTGVRAHLDSTGAVTDVLFAGGADVGHVDSS